MSDDLDPELLSKPYAGMTAWHAIPTALKILLCLCVAGLIAIPVFSPQWLRKKKGEIAAAPVPPSDLSLSEERFQAKSRTIKGTIVNSSDTPYHDITISYGVTGKRGGLLGTVEATLERVGPHDKASFETSKVPPDAANFGLLGIAGTPP